VGELLARGKGTNKRKYKKSRLRRGGGSNISQSVANKGRDQKGEKGRSGSFRKRAPKAGSTQKPFRLKITALRGVRRGRGKTASSGESSDKGERDLEGAKRDPEQHKRGETISSCVGHNTDGGGTE